MYLRILKKDLRRKKTMNIIMLLFIILAATFITSSVNNLISISTALDSYFNKAGLSDILIITIAEENNDSAIHDYLYGNRYVENWEADESLFATEDDISIHNGTAFTSSTVFLSSLDIKQQKFFDSSSVCLILIALVILRFTIIFTLNEEFREIGVMKAIGIQNRSIRKLYIVRDSVQQ